MVTSRSDSAEGWVHSPRVGPRARAQAQAETLATVGISHGTSSSSATPQVSIIDHRSSSRLLPPPLPIYTSHGYASGQAVPVVAHESTFLTEAACILLSNF